MRMSRQISAILQLAGRISTLREQNIVSESFSNASHLLSLAFYVYFGLGEAELRWTASHRPRVGVLRGEVPLTFPILINSHRVDLDI